MTLQELQALHRSGEAVVRPEEAEPWRILKCSRATFYRELRDGRIPGTLRLGHGYRLRLADLLAWLGEPPLARDADGSSGHCGSCQHTTGTEEAGQCGECER